MAEEASITNFTFLAPAWLWLLTLCPLWLVISLYHQKQSLLDLKSFRKTSLVKTNQYIHQVLMQITLVFLILALAKPGWDPQPQGGETQGRDMVFLLDVSRSMLVNDARPNRLEVARQAIQNTINNSKSDRFGLVVFAGSTSIQSPLTNDKTFFNYLLDQINSDSVAQGGTRIEDALFKVLDKMSNKNHQNAMDIILISDGEDLGSQPERALNKLNELGARLIVIGLGDSKFGGRIPSRDNAGWQFYQGKEIWSKMNTAKLRTLAQGAKQGMFIPVGTATFDLAKIVEKLRQVWPTSELRKGQVLTYHQGYPYCLFIALLAQMLCWLRGKNIWLTGLILFSFNSQAFTNERNTELNNEINYEKTSENTYEQTMVNIAPDDLAKLTTSAQFLRAQSLFKDNPEQAAEVYSYIANQAKHSNIAIQANYNLATSLIFYGEALTLQLNLVEGTAEELTGELENQYNFFDDDEYIDPEIYYQQAADILRIVLLHEPKHLASQNNLEWLVERAKEQKDDDMNNPPASKQSAQTQQKSQEKESSKDQQSDQNSDQVSDQEQSKSTQSQVNETTSLQLHNVSLPEPQASAEEMLQQAKERNLSERAPNTKKQTKVEKDW